MLLREAVDFQCRAPSVHTAKVSLFTVPRVFWLAAFWGCLALVTVFALTPVTVPLPSTPWDKANHALAFAVLYALAGQCWPGKGRLVFLALLAYGGAIYRTTAGEISNSRPRTSLSITSKVETTGA